MSIDLYYLKGDAGLSKKALKEFRMFKSFVNPWWDMSLVKVLSY